MISTVFVKFGAALCREGSGAVLSAHVYERGVSDPCKVKTIKTLEYEYPHDDLTADQALYAALLEGIAMARRRADDVVFITEDRALWSRLKHGAPVPKHLRAMHRMTMLSLGAADRDDGVLCSTWKVWWDEAA